MKRLMLMAATIVLAGSFVRAADMEATPGHAHTGPCKDILAACNAAGYFKGGHKAGPNKGEWIDCMDPIMKGQAVPGVNVTPAQVSGCQEVRAKHQAHKAAHGTAPTTTAPTAPTAPAAAH